MTVDRTRRVELRSALVAYMRGEIRTFAFDERNSACGDPKATADAGLREISGFLWTIHDDLVDHPVSVGPQAWQVLRRVVAFLGTDLDPTGEANDEPWPFRDQGQWKAHESLADDGGLPDYDPALHGRPANPWFNRIPSEVGFLAVGLLLAAVVMLILLT